MSNPYVTLVHCTTIMYLASKTDGSWTPVIDVVKESLENISIPKSTIGETQQQVAGKNTLSMLSWMIRTFGTIEFTKEDILSRVRLDLDEEPSLLAELTTSLMVDGDGERSSKRIYALSSSLRYELNNERARRIISSANKKVNYSDELVDVRDELRELQENIVSFVGEGEGGEKPGFVARLSTGDRESLKDTLVKTSKSYSEAGMIKTGLVGLNRGCGGFGYRRGEFVNFGGLPHQYKTGILNDCVRWACIHNEPYMLDEKKKPLVLRISFENQPDQDLPLIYKSLVEHETRQSVDVKNVDPDKATDYIIEKLGVNGYTFDMLCYDANVFKVYDVLDVLEDYAREGYEIHLVAIDYLELIASKDGSKRIDEAINGAVETVRNHCYSRGITVVNGHQLSTEAQELAREGTTNLPKLVAKGGYYRNTKSLHTKLDLEWIIHKHKFGEKEYLVFARGKHRGISITPEAHCNFAYEFHKVGGIVDDIHDDVPKVIYDLGRRSNDSEDGVGGEDLGFGDDDVPKLENPVEEAW